MIQKKYSDSELTKAVLMIIEQGMRPVDVANKTGINLRTLQRFKSRYIGKIPESSLKEERKKLEAPVLPVIADNDNIVSTAEVQKALDKTLIERAKFLDDVFEAKQVILARLVKIGRKSQNVDALQKTLKTLNDIEDIAAPNGDNPAIHAKTVNMFQFFNQQLIQDGYKGPELSPSDIIKGY